MKARGRIEVVSVREVWANEASDFTPWLAEHLNLLGAALGMDLEVVQREAPVGGFSLDILARDRQSGQLVAIENQLEWTDHAHLGQILTYAAGHDARAAVWVTPNFRDEHRAAIDWLNRWTTEEIRFWGVEVRAIKIGDSLPAPEFRAVASPNDWSKMARQTALSAAAPHQEEMLRFFNAVSKHLLANGFAAEVFMRSGRIPRYFPTPYDGLSYAGEISYGMVWAFLWISKGSFEEKQGIFDALEAEQAEIEAELEAEWDFSSYGTHRWASIGICTAGSIDDPPEKLEQHKAWLLEHLPKLKAVLHPRLERIMAEAPDGASA